MATRLHVVYAGRGDAMIVQDGAQLYLLDGGPQGLTPEVQSGAPYYRYYMSSVRAVASEMGRALTSIAPDAVIVSHAHEDHFGGIQAIFERFLSPTYATQPSGDRTLVFNGPLVTQMLDDLRTNDDMATFEGLLAAFNFRRARSPPQGPVFDAFRFAGDAGVSYSVFQRAASTLLGRDWTVDTSADNLKSVLMFHKATKMVFTGDSVGYLIAPFVDACVNGLADPTLAVFKVPHHGSMRNSQRAAKATSVPARAWKERALLCVLADPSMWDDIAMPYALQDAGAAAAAAQALESLCGHSVDPDQLLAALHDAYDQTTQNIEAGVNPPWAYADADIDTVGLWSDLIERLDAQSLASLTQTGADRNAVGGRRRRDQWMASLKRSWYSRLSYPETHRDDYEGRLARGQLHDFFAGFAAWNYVVSADGQHFHPAAETLAAIATVATENRRNVRIFVTDGSAVDLDGIDALAPAGWSAYADIRYLARGARIVLDVTNPANATNLALLDPLGTTAPVASAFSLDALQAQFLSNRGAAIPGRTLGDDTYQLQVDGQPLWLNLGAAGAIAVGAAAQSFQIDDAWTLSLAAPAELPFPSSFDDVRVRGTVTATGAQTSRIFTLVAAGARGQFLLRVLPPTFVPARYVSTDATRDFQTTDPSAAAAFAIVRVAAGAAGLPVLVPARRRRVVAAQLAVGSGDGPVTLRAFLQTLGEPVDQALPVDAVLPQLVGPDNAAALAEGITLHVAERVLGWNADLDASTVTASEDEHGPLVIAAEIAIQMGTPVTFTIDDQQETIASASATLALSVDGPLTLEAALETIGGIRVADDASVASPSRARPLDQYLHGLGVDPASTANVTLGTLLTAIVGAQTIAERLLMRAPSFIASAGIAQWLLDHTASAVEVDVNVAGDSEVRTARIATQTPAGIQATIEGLALSITDVAIAVADARLPTMEVVLEATATIGTTQLAARATLTDERPALDLSLPEGATLADLVALLPGAPALGGLTVPVAGAALSGLSFRAPGIVLAQPVGGGDAYELAEVHGTIAYDGWASILPAGWPAPLSSTLGVRVLSPLDARETQVAVDVEFTFFERRQDVHRRPRGRSAPGSRSELGVHAEPAFRPRRRARDGERGARRRRPVGTARHARERAAGGRGRLVEPRGDGARADARRARERAGDVGRDRAGPGAARRLGAGPRRPGPLDRGRQPRLRGRAVDGRRERGGDPGRRAPRRGGGSAPDRDVAWERVVPQLQPRPDRDRARADRGARRPLLGAGAGNAARLRTVRGGLPARVRAGRDDPLDRRRRVRAVRRRPSARRARPLVARGRGRAAAARAGGALHELLDRGELGRGQGRVDRLRRRARAD